MEPQQFKKWLCSPPEDRKPLVMGVLNVTPDSFSDGGKRTGTHAARDATLTMISDGADLIDIGGESTRPGALPIEVDEQIRRVVPVLLAIREAGAKVTISVDSTRAAVVSAALDAGADLVNDVSAGRDDPDLLPLVAARRVPVVLMHMQGTPLTMQAAPTYSDVTAEVIAFLKERVSEAERAGIEPGNVIVDPGIGFGKTIEHNLQLLRDTSALAAALAPVPLLVGASRKGFIGKITGEPVAERRQFGTAATVAWAVANGAGIVRVHDVGAMVQVVRMVRAIARGATGVDDA